MHVVITVVGQRPEHWTDLFALVAAEPGLRLSVLVAGSPTASLTSLLDLERIQPSLEVHPLPHRLGEDGGGHIASIRFRTGALERADIAPPDVIHVIGEASYLSTRQVLRWRAHHHPDVPVTMYAAQDTLLPLPFPFSALERRSHRDVEHAIAITPAALDVLRHKGFRGRATVVPLGVDVDRFVPSRSSARTVHAGSTQAGNTQAGSTQAGSTQAGSTGRRSTVGYVGPLEPRQGVADLVEVTERLDADLVVCGRGSDEFVVRTAAARRPDRVRWIDRERPDELPVLLRELDVLVRPTQDVVPQRLVGLLGLALRTQSGQALMEAMACGVPVVGSDLGEIAHLIGDAGLVYPAGDLTALTCRLARLRDVPGLADQLGRAGRRRAVAVYSWQRQLERLLALWSAEIGRTTASSVGPEPEGVHP